MSTKLQPPNTHHLNAVQGWIGLGNLVEANAELKKIPARLLSHPDVLEVRWQLCAKEHKWNDCVDLANKLVELAPKSPLGWVHRSFALHELRQTREALDALLPAATMFPGDWLIQYNLACYCCRLGQLERAVRFLDQSFKVGNAKEIRRMALADADLKELWERIGTP